MLSLFRVVRSLCFTFMMFGGVGIPQWEFAQGWGQVAGDAATVCSGRGLGDPRNMFSVPGFASVVSRPSLLRLALG